MKTLFVSLAALVAVSGAALAAGGDDLRSSDTYFGLEIELITQDKAGNYAHETAMLLHLQDPPQQEGDGFRGLHDEISDEGGKATD